VTGHPVGVPALEAAQGTPHRGVELPRVGPVGQLGTGCDRRRALDSGLARNAVP
jgi:hypothetical protein